MTTFSRGTQTTAK